MFVCCCCCWNLSQWTETDEGWASQTKKVSINNNLKKEEEKEEEERKKERKHNESKTGILKGNYNI